MPVPLQILVNTIYCFSLQLGKYFEKVRNFDTIKARIDSAQPGDD